jgi:hypothetical protein
LTSRQDVARAIAFFEQCDDVMLLHRLSGEIAPRAKQMVGQLIARGGEDAIPPPADLRGAREPATAAQAVATLATVNDFALLQVLARGIGQRIETLEIAASAQFPEGARVLVPTAVAFPPARADQPGTVEATGTMLLVRLDNGESWSGPPSLTQLAPR